MQNEKFEKIEIYNSPINNNRNIIPNNKNALFYRKSSLQNNKTSFFNRKKDNNSTKIKTQKINISGYKKKNKIYKYISEDTNPSTKIKSINYSKDISSIESKYEDSNSNPEKINSHKVSVSPFSIQSNDSFKNINNSSNYIYVNKKTQAQNQNNRINRNKSNSFINYDNIKIKKLTVDNQQKNNLMNNNSNIDQNRENNNGFVIFNNNEKNSYIFKVNNYPKNEIHLQRSLINKSKYINYQNNKNNKEFKIIKNNYTIDIDDNSYNEIKYNNKSSICLTNTNINNNNNKNKESKESKYIINKINKNNKNIDTNLKTELYKGKIIKFKYNGTEFFFHPTHNKTHNIFYKSAINLEKNEKIINASKTIQKWWKRIIFIKAFTLKHKFNFLINTIKNIMIRSYFGYLKLKMVFIKKIVFIQRKWRELLIAKKETISSIYNKNDTYGYDNSNRNNYGENFYINTSEFINTNENNNNNINNKILINDLFFGYSDKKRLFQTNKQINNNNSIIKKIYNNTCFISKTKYNNILNKIILIQRNIKLFLNKKYLFIIKKIYKNIYSNNIVTNKFDSLKISFKKENQFSIFRKNKKYEISNYYFFINKECIDKVELYNIIKNEDINYNGISKKNNNILNINKINEIEISILQEIPPLQMKKNKESIKKFNDNKMNVCNNIEYSIKQQKYKNKNKSFIIDENKIIFSLNEKENIETEHITEIIKLPLIKEFCLLEKTKLNNNYIKTIKYIQDFYRNYKNNKSKKNPMRKILLNSKTNNNIYTKVYKDNSLNLSSISKIQKKFKNFRNSKNNPHFFKPINLNAYITKKYIIKTKLYGYEKLKYNNKLNIITQNQLNDYNDINDIDELPSENEENEENNNNLNDITKNNTIKIYRKGSNERNSTYINENEENKNEIPIKVMHTKIYRNSINSNLNSYKNVRLNNNNHKYININIESLPSVYSLYDNNDLCNCDNNIMNKNKSNNNNISIQTLDSKENTFKENLINLNNIKRVTTEEDNYKKNPIETENDNNYFYTENDIARFSFSNGDLNFLNNSIFRKTTKQNNFKGFINKRIIKLTCIKIKKMIYTINFYIFIQILIQRIKKYIHKIVLNKILKRKNNTNFYLIIKNHIKIYIEIIKDKNYHNFLQNDIFKLIKNNLYNKYLLEMNKNKFLYMTNEQEKNLIETNLFINADKDLINYYFLYYKIIYNLCEDKNYNNLIQFRLIKDPLLNMNVFSITKYMDELYNDIIHDNICKKCFCKKKESCSINCNCHIKNNNAINLINKIKYNVNQNNKLFYITSPKNKENSKILDSFNQKEKSNIRIVIKKVKRSSADIIRCKFNNLEESNECCSSSDIDIFQKMNTGIKSLINKVKINKAFKDFNQNKKNKKNMIKIGRIYTETGDSKIKKKNDNPIIDNIESNKYHTFFYNIKKDNN